jgi:hypothetical protein
LKDIHTHRAASDCFGRALTLGRAGGKSEDTQRYQRYQTKMAHHA